MRLTGTGRTHLPAWPHPFADNSAHDTAALRAGLARFQFLLGGDEGRCPAAPCDI